jgi:Ser/Thr protein kinase RdoA (MazF antagonist)
VPLLYQSSRLDIKGVFRLQPDLIVAWLAARYGAAFASADCQLLRSYTNDVYLIGAQGQKFALKLYGLGWRTLAEVQWEIDLLLHLSAHGVPVAQPIAARGQGPIQSIATEFGDRIGVLFAYAPGDKPQPPFSTALYELFGEAIGRMHLAADSFVTAHARRALDTAVLIDEPVTLAAPLLPKANERAWLRALAGVVKDRIKIYAAAGLDWGPIHGDATLDNLHVTGDGTVILYDFDLAGPGWRAADIQGWAVNHVEYQPRWDAFHRGYARARPLAEVDLAAAPYLILAWDIWALKIDLERRVIAQGAEQVRAYLGAQLEQLRARSAQYGIAAEI